MVLTAVTMALQRRRMIRRASSSLAASVIGVSLMDGGGGDGAAGGMDERVGGVVGVAGGQVDGNPVQATPAAVDVVGKAHGIIR